MAICLRKDLNSTTMKILCLERDNTTFQSLDDGAGNSYRSSFELFPFHEGKDHAVYKGMLNGTGPKRGMFCAVKACVTHTGREADWWSVVEASRTGRQMATLFNQVLKRQVVRFTLPLVAQMNKVSDFSGVMKLFQPHEKKLKLKEYVLLEDFIEGTFKRFSSASGASTDVGEADMTQAFSHFTWHQSRELGLE
ncbi:uncharacterized protein [Haliotis cracherodii]|uniref:uncharacterized protein n=1 Tax=Haliotis cracherodii TaxID=6455 RepID=UPI0039ED713E